MTTNNDVIIPPPEVQRIIEKTADYVAKGGLALEEKIKQKEDNNPRFAFLKDSDPYHLFYQQKLDEILTEGAVKKQPKKGPTQQTAAPKKASKEPPKSEFEFDIPTISGQDYDIIRLTALFYARNGQEFITNLQQKEARNYQFEFLRPNHSLHPLFTKFVEQYTKILLKQSVPRIESIVSDKYGVLKRCYDRVEYEKKRAQDRKKQEQEAEKERIEFLKVDWHDFVVVQTVEFTEQENFSDLPMPTTVQALQSIPLEKRRLMIPT
ncbi:hypothetical protein MP638_005991 [Amoeboaphelidium occidentale]|nr:hypothetical protein MP638_005991 [Amoeboaphelidium occidentale]